MAAEAPPSTLADLTSYEVSPTTVFVPDTDPLVEAARSVYTCFGDWKTKIV